MGLFGIRPRLTDADYFGSAAATFAQAISVIVRTGGIPSDTGSDIGRAYVEVAGYLELRIDGAAYVQAFMAGELPPIPNLPLSPNANLDVIVPGSEDALDDLTGHLNARFLRPIGRDEALQTCITLCQNQVSRFPRTLNGELAEPCGLVLGLAMKTIQDDTVTSGRKEREKRIQYGALIGSYASTWALASRSSDGLE